MHEELLLGLSAVDDLQRVRALELLVQAMAKEEPEQGEIDAGHPLMDKLNFLAHDRFPAVRRVHPFVLGLQLSNILDCH